MEKFNNFLLKSFNNGVFIFGTKALFTLKNINFIDLLVLCNDSLKLNVQSYLIKRVHCFVGEYILSENFRSSFIKMKKLFDLRKIENAMTQYHGCFSIFMP